MNDTATASTRSRRRRRRLRMTGICAAVVAPQIILVALVPPSARGVAAGLLTMATIMAALVAAMELSFKRAAVRAAEAGARAADLPWPRDRISTQIQRAYHLARRESSVAHIAGSCEIPEAFAALIIDDVRRTASRKSRARDSSGRPHSDGRRPRNPPAI